jgi:hypothetical protein
MIYNLLSALVQLVTFFSSLFIQNTAKRKKKTMNCQIANQRSIVEFLKSRNINPKRKYSRHWWYLSPIRSETNPSFAVDLRNNRWYDKAADVGGDLVALVKEIHSTDTSGALAILGKNEIKPFSFDEQKLPPPKPAIEIISESAIRHYALLQYLDERKIPHDIARRYLREVHFFSTDRQKRFFSLGFQNSAGGWALRNRYSKTAVSPAHFTLLHGAGNKKNHLCMFEGIFDFLSSLVHFKIIVPRTDVVVLNSSVHLNKIAPLFSKYERINTFFDNDDTGDRLTDEVKEAHPHVQDYRWIYQEQNDFNEYLIEK